MLTPLLIKNGSMFVLPAFNPVSFMEAIEKHRITTTLMVPTMVLALIDHPRFGEFDSPALRRSFTARPRSRPLA